MKTNFKKIFAVMLALAMVLTAIPAMADATVGSITVNNLHSADDKVMYAQIIKPAPTTETGWVFVDGVLPAFASAYELTQGVDPDGKDPATDDTAVPADETLAAFEQRVMKAVIADYEGTENGAASTGAANASANFQKALANVAELDNLDLREMDGAVKNLYNVNTDAGVYFITVEPAEGSVSYNNMAAYVKFGTYSGTEYTYLEDVTVDAKKVTNIVNKTLGNTDGESTAIGDEIDYVITSRYPFFATQYEKPLYQIYDYSDELVFAEDDIAVNWNGVTLDASEYTIEMDDDNHGFTITFDYDRNYAGKDVTVVYKGTVVALADYDTTDADDMEDQVINTATVTTNPGEKNDKDEIVYPDEDNWTTESVVISDTHSFKLTKVDEQGTALSGAHFQVKVGDEVLKFKSEGDGVYTLTLDGTGVSDLVVADGTDKNGKGVLILNGLDGQYTYIISETVAPKGYNLTPTVVTIDTVDAENIVESTVQSKDAAGVVTTTTTYTIMDEKKSAELSYENQTGTLTNTKMGLLPSTGGIGTYVFTMTGTAVMAAAVIFFMKRKEAIEF